MSATSSAASPGFASRILSFGLGLGFGFGLGGGGGGGGGGRGLRGGSTSFAASRRGLVLSFLGSTATSSDAPQSFAPRLRRKCSTSSGFAVGPFASIPNTAFPVASVSPALPKRRLPAV